MAALQYGSGLECVRRHRTLGVNKAATPRTLRHCFATNLRESGSLIRTAQELPADPRDARTARLHLGK